MNSINLRLLLFILSVCVFALTASATMADSLSSGGDSQGALFYKASENAGLGDNLTDMKKKKKSVLDKSLEFKSLKQKVDAKSEKGNEFTEGAESVRD